MESAFEYIGYSVNNVFKYTVNTFKKLEYKLSKQSLSFLDESIIVCEEISLCLVPNKIPDIDGVERVPYTNMAMICRTLPIEWLYIFQVWK